MNVKNLFKNLFSKTEADATAKANLAEQNAKNYTDIALVKTPWDFTKSSAVTIHYSDMVVNNGVVMGSIKFKFNASGSGWRELGTTTEIPIGDVTFPLINLSGASWLGELQVRTDGTVQAFYSSTYANDAFVTIIYNIS